MTIRRASLLAGAAVAALSIVFWMWSDAGSQRSEAANEQAKTEMHLEIDGSFLGPVHCDSRTQTSCVLLNGSTFTLHVVPSAIPIGGYGVWQTLIDYGNLTYKPADLGLEDTWDLTLARARVPSAPTGKEGQILHQAFSAVFEPLPTSTQKTSFLNLTFNCSGNDKTPNVTFSTTISSIPFEDETQTGSTYVGADAQPLYIPNASSIDIECEPPMTPLPTKQPDPGDTDLDGCSDQAENGPDESFGGRRHYLYFWDFYDVWTHPPGDPVGWERNGVINIFDIIAVGMRFGGGFIGNTKEDAQALALLPPDQTISIAAFDRGPPIGPNPWDVGPPDGSINIPDDILGVAQQFGHDCS